MRVQIDSAGRIVIPKPIRERWRFRPNTRIEVEELADGLKLKPEQPEPSLVQRGPMLMHTGKPPAHLDWNRLTEDAVDERIKDVLGL